VEYHDRQTDAVWVPFRVEATETVDLVRSRGGEAYKDGNIIHSDSWNERATA
jgi:hypothetical protein